jgi:hypothetical protein
MFTDLKDFQFPPTTLYNLRNKEEDRKYIEYQLTQTHLDRVVFRNYSNTPYCIVIMKNEFHLWGIEPAEEQEKKLHYWEPPKEYHLTEGQDFQTAFLPFEKHEDLYDIKHNLRYDLRHRNCNVFSDRRLVFIDDRDCSRGVIYKFNHPYLTNAGSIEITRENQHLWEIRISKDQDCVKSEEPVRSTPAPKPKEFKQVECHTQFEECKLYDLLAVEEKAYFYKVKPDFGISKLFRFQLQGTKDLHFFHEDRHQWMYRESLDQTPGVIQGFRNVISQHCFNEGTLYDLRHRESGMINYKVYLQSWTPSFQFVTQKGRVVGFYQEDKSDWEYRVSPDQEETTPDLPETTPEPEVKEVWQDFGEYLDTTCLVPGNLYALRLNDDEKKVHDQMTLIEIIDHTKDTDLYIFESPLKSYTITISSNTEDYDIRECDAPSKLDPDLAVGELYPFKDFDGFNVFKNGVAYDLRSKDCPDYYERVYISPEAEGGTFLSAPSRKELHRTVVCISFHNRHRWEYRESVIEEPTPKVSFTEERLEEKYTFIFDTLTEITDLLIKMHEEFVRNGKEEDVNT